MNNNVSTLLQITSSTIHQFRDQQRERGDDFNIFKILNNERSEVGTHSLFLFELLSPEGCHYQGNIFSDFFLTQVLELENYGSIIEVKREDPTEYNRRIDFTINTSEYLIGIEMKIDAGDQYKQLYDYNKELEKRNKENDKKVIMYYLTLNGSDPSPSSLNDLKGVKNISFKKDINNWLSSCIEVVTLKPVIRELISQYQTLIKKLTNQHKELNMKTIEEIMKSKDNLVAAEKIANNYSQAAAEIEANVWRQIATCLDPKPFEYSSDKSWEEEKQYLFKNNSWSGLKFNMGKITNKTDCYLWADFKIISSYNYLHFHLYPGNKLGEQLNSYDFKNDKLTNVLEKEYPEKAAYDSIFFIRKCFDNTFKLRGSAEELSEWLDVNNKSENINDIANKINKELKSIESVAFKYLEDRALEIA